MTHKLNLCDAELKLGDCDTKSKVRNTKFKGQILSHFIGLKYDLINQNHEF